MCTTAHTCSANSTRGHVLYSRILLVPQVDLICLVEAYEPTQETDDDDAGDNIDRSPHYPQQLEEPGERSFIAEDPSYCPPHPVPACKCDEHRPVEQGAEEQCWVGLDHVHHEHPDSQLNVDHHRGECRHEQQTPCGKPQDRPAVPHYITSLSQRASFQK